MILIIKKNFKLKKKWRFWRVFKQFFLNQKKKIIFVRLKWFFNQKRILWHRLAELYGKTIKNLVYVKSKSKFAFKDRFIYLLVYLETRFNILLMRIRFSQTIINSNTIIKQHFALINNSYKHTHYLVCVGDVIELVFLSKIISVKKCLKRLIKKRYFWRKMVKKYKTRNKKKQLLNFWWYSKKILVVNYIEINYKIFSAILIRKPLTEEVFLNNTKKTLSANIFKKIFSLY